MTKQATTQGTVPEKKREDDRLILRRRVKEILFHDYSNKREGQTLESVVDELSVKLHSNNRDVVSAIRALVKSGEITLVEKEPSHSLCSYSFRHYSNWFWLALIATLVSVGLVFATSGLALDLRYFFGTLLLLFLPGYSIVEVLFSRHNETRTDQGFVVTKIGLSIGLSLVLVASVALVLNYTTLGITPVSLAFSLFMITIFCLILALVRRYKQYRLSHYPIKK